MVKSKCKVNQNSLQAGVKIGSFVWNSIKKAKDILEDGFKMGIGAGKVSFWFNGEKICNLVPYVHVNDLQLRVSDVWRGTGWDFHGLSTPIPEERLCLPAGVGTSPGYGNAERKSVFSSG
ncbi:hypothetical protein SESBI_20836 [Sesbania bispinosa]|nr:hypothetical protein SESBI_20836 [Sesbania bispinosa]